MENGAVKLWKNNKLVNLIAEIPTLEGTSVTSYLQFRIDWYIHYPSIKLLEDTMKKYKVTLSREEREELMVYCR